jgi:hypothetical protein
MQARLWVVGLVLIAFAATGCRDKLLVTYVNETDEAVLVWLGTDGPLEVDAGGSLDTSYGNKSMHDEPYAITASSLAGEKIFEVVLTDDELEALDHRIVIAP